MQCDMGLVLPLATRLLLESDCRGVVARESLIRLQCGTTQL